MEEVRGGIEKDEGSNDGDGEEEGFEDLERFFFMSFEGVFFIILGFSH